MVLGYGRGGDDATRRYTVWDSLYRERLPLHLSSPVLYRESEGDQHETDRQREDAYEPR